MGAGGEDQESLTSAAEARDSKASGRILVFVPMYNCATQVQRVLGRIAAPSVASVIDGVLCIDNRSSDGTLEAARRAIERVPVAERIVMQNAENYGLGGSHKVAINEAREREYCYLVVLHGDDQGDIGDLVPLLEAGAHRQVDFLMGARFMRGSKLMGYSKLRVFANITFNLIFSVVCRRKLYDLGSGLNLFRVSAFDDDFHRQYADDLTFNYFLILGIAALGKRLVFFPLSWREEDQVSNARLFRMGLQLLRIVALRRFRPRLLLEGEHRQTPREAYSATTLSYFSAGGATDANA
ncbi:MAG: glycosyltransferase family 2 protein [Pseudomonadota bacterium]